MTTPSRRAEPQEVPGIELLKERNTLSQALLQATASLAQGQSPLAILQLVCESLVNASEHIRLAWMIPEELDAATLRPYFAAGPARDYAKGLVFSTDQSKGPLRRSIDAWEPVTGNIATDWVFSEVREAALGQQLRSTLCLPIGRRGSQYEALVAIYADLHDYFNIIGLDVFTAFAHVVSAAMEQATLLNTLSHIASHDQLTDTLNRRGLQERLKSELSLAKRYDRGFSLILLDLDRFKLINDGLGHSVGDKVLVHVAGLLHSKVRDEDVLGRWGGEEFLCILPETNHDGAALFAERMRQVLAATPLQVAEQQVQLTASFGYATYPEDGTSLDALLGAADAALYQAKYSGRNRSVGAGGDYLRIHTIANQLDLALRHNRVVPAYQPIVDLKTGETVAEESLARMVSSDGSVHEAGHFIEAASRLQILHRIDATIMDQALQHCVDGLTSGTNRRKHFINISADLLRHRELIHQLLAQAQHRCIACADLISAVKPIVIEITERELLHNMDVARELLAPFIDFGFTLALDDFGSGYSSYQYLVELPIQIIKIDGELIRRLPDPRVRAVVQGIQDTAKNLGITTVAEYIENAETAELLREIGIDWGQGYYYGRPQLA